MLRIRIIIDKLPLWTQPAQYSEDIIPVSTTSPSLESRILNLGIQHRCDMDGRHVFHVDIESY